MGVGARLSGWLGGVLPCVFGGRESMPEYGGASSFRAPAGSLESVPEARSSQERGSGPTGSHGRSGGSSLTHSAVEAHDRATSWNSSFYGQPSSRGSKDSRMEDWRRSDSHDSEALPGQRRSHSSAGERRRSSSEMLIRSQPSFPAISSENTSEPPRDSLDSVHSRLASLPEGHRLQQRQQKILAASGNERLAELTRITPRPPSPPRRARQIGGVPKCLETLSNGSLVGRELAPPPP